MARTTLTPILAKGPNPGTVAADSLDFAFASSDSSNGNDFAASGNDLILWQNTDVSARTITIASVADNLGRTGDVTTYSVGAGEFGCFYVGAGNGWQQSTGKVNINTSNALLKVVVLQLGPR